MLGQTLRSLLAVALAIAAGGCTTDETNATTGDPTLQPIDITLRLANPNRCCAQVLKGPDTAHPFVLPIQVQVEGAGASSFMLRPPGYCRFGGLTKCGHLVATVRRFDSQGSEIETVVRGSSTTLIEVPLSGPGDVSVVVTAFDDEGTKTLAEVPADKVSPQASCVAPADDEAPCPPFASDAGADGG